VEEATVAAKTALLKAYKDGSLLEGVGTVGGVAAAGADYLLRDPARDGRNVRVNVRGPLTITRILPPLGKLVSPTLKALGVAQFADSKSFAEVFVTKPNPPSAPIDDRNARTTFADLQNSQHRWLALDWTSVAATTTTQVFSPFALDRSAGAGMTLSSHKLVTGEVGDFNQDLFVAFAERSVGGVGGDVTRTPDLAS
jgi:hypothetical protein